MATLADMKVRIEQETTRNDLVDAIETEIVSAIKFYRGQRFYFNEQRTTVTFNTVNAQSDYGSADQANIPDLISIDSISATASGSVTLLCQVTQDRMEVLLGGNSPLGGPPTHYSYYGQALRLYPIPNGIYPVRIAGVIRVPVPNLGDLNNAWMNDGEELIRLRAKKNLYANWMRDTEAAADMDMLEQRALDNLRAETSRRTSVSRIRSYDL